MRAIESREGGSIDQQKEGLPSRLFEHFKHFRLEYVVHRFDTDCRSGLRHSEYVDDLNGAEYM